MKWSEKKQRYSDEITEDGNWEDDGGESDDITGRRMVIGDWSDDGVGGGGTSPSRPRDESGS